MLLKSQEKLTAITHHQRKAPPMSCPNVQQSISGRLSEPPVLFHSSQVSLLRPRSSSWDQLNSWTNSDPAPGSLSRASTPPGLSLPLRWALFAAPEPESALPVRRGPDGCRLDGRRSALALSVNNADRCWFWTKCRYLQLQTGRWVVLEERLYLKWVDSNRGGCWLAGCAGRYN